MAPNLLVNVFFLQRIEVVTFFECVSRAAKSPGISVSLQKRWVISRSPGNVQKCPGIEGIDIDLYLQLPEKCSATTPPPTERGPPQETTGISATNLVGFWRSRKMYQVASAGCPPKQKSWLRRWPLTIHHNLITFCGFMIMNKCHEF